MVELRPHQRQAVKDMHNGCILTGDVGSGKSITALMYYYMKVCGGVPVGPGLVEEPMTNPKDLWIFTTAKKRNDQDWYKEAARFGLGREANPDGVCVHVDSWNNLPQYEDLKDAFIIFDEQRLVGAGAWVKTMLKLAKSNQWIILSATPGDVWMDYIPVFVANGFYKNRTEFVRRHVVYSQWTSFPKVERYVETSRLERLRRQILVEMPFTRHTVRHEKQILVEYDQVLYDRVAKDRWHVYEDRPIKDVSELTRVLRRVVNSDPSRLGETLKVLEKHPRLIIFYNYNYELDFLRTLSNVLPCPVKEWNGQKHDSLPEGDSWVYLVQYTAGNEGWECTTTDTELFFSLNYSYKISHQSRGRIDRMNTPYVDLNYYTLRSISGIDTAIQKSLATKKQFNEKAYGEQLWSEFVPF